MLNAVENPRTQRKHTHTHKHLIWDGMAGSIHKENIFNTAVKAKNKVIIRDTWNG